jgi:pimeloyl-ACP methyl ester carboxylesterase
VPSLLPVNGVELCAETFGREGDPAILLIAGAACSMDWWEPGFCERLAAGGRLIVRYDHRDTGGSTSYPPGEPGYVGADLVADAAGLLDALGIGAAHVAGLSMGGAIALVLALEHPGRVATLTLLSTSPGGDDLPAMTEGLRAVFADPAPEPDWSDRSAVIDYLVEAERPFTGAGTFDEAHVREIATRVVDRATSVASAGNHWLLDDDGPPLRPRLGRIRAPALVVHGTADPMFPPAHGAALARELPDAELLLLDGLGHQFPPPELWDRIVPAILAHTSR